MAKKKQQLGRGVRALLQNIETEVQQGQPKPFKMLPLKNIEANPDQPRKDFDELALQELAASIKALGLIQPITVRRLGNKYQLISGERRFRASSLAGLEEIPVYIREANDQEMLEMALVENLQRENLNAIEVATTYKRLMDECQLTHDLLSERVGKNRSTITNYLGLLELLPEVQIGLKLKNITTGHAKALKGLGDAVLQLRLYRKTLEHSWSVRQLEEQVRFAKLDKNSEKVKTPRIPEDYERPEANLGDFFQTKVQLKVNEKGKGQIMIPFSNTKDFNRILDLLDL